MATFEDVLSVVETYNSAISARDAAQTALDSAANDAESDVVTEATAYVAAQQAYFNAQSIARANHGYPAALSTFENADSAAQLALSTMRDTMIEFLSSS